MAELSYEHKVSLSEPRFLRDDRVFHDHVVPSPENEAVRAFAAELSSAAPLVVPCAIDDEPPTYGWPADAVRMKIESSGGSIQFGWRLREWPGLLLTAEFHAVWVNTYGDPIDTTPSVASGEISLFIPVPDTPETFDFDQRPPTRYKVLYQAADHSAAVADRIARMKPTQRAYEERRAQKVGKTLEQWVLAKFYGDPMPELIDAFIDSCKEYDAKLPSLPDFLVTEAGVRDEPAEPALSAADAGSAPTPDDEASSRWGPDDETAAAADELFDWSAPRYNRRRDILRAMGRA